MGPYGVCTTRFKKPDSGPDSFMAESESTRRVAWDSAESGRVLTSEDSAKSNATLRSLMGLGRVAWLSPMGLNQVAMRLGRVP